MLERFETDWKTHVTRSPVFVLISLLTAIVARLFMFQPEALVPLP